MDYAKYNEAHSAISPTAKQLAAITSSNFPIYLKASAGTGKTEVLINKILDILESDKTATLNNFLIVTFTNKATNELQRRLSDRLYFEWLKHKKTAVSTGKLRTETFAREQLKLSNMINISTIHILCEKLLRDFGIQIGVAPNFKIKSFRKESSEIIVNTANKYYDNIMLKGVAHFHLIRLIDIFMEDNANRGITINKDFADTLNLTTKQNKFWNELKKLFVKIYLESYAEIEKLKKENNILTPNDLIKYASKLLLNDDIVRNVCRKYKYLLLDEFQDTNKDQFILVNSLINNGIKVFLVGDEQQAIYSFRGADVQSSFEMSKIIDNLKNDESTDSFLLNENFRTDYRLIEYINKVFDREFKFSNSILKFPFVKLDKISEKRNLDYGVDKPFRLIFDKKLAAIIKHLIEYETIGERKVDYNDIAVLCRRNYDLDRLALSLKLENIPVEVSGGKGFYRSSEVIDTHKILSAVVYNENALFTELCFTDYYKAFIQYETPSSFKDFINDLEAVVKDESVESILDYIYAKTHIIEYYYNKNHYQEVANLEKLKNIAAELMSREYIQPIHFADYLNTMIITGQEDENNMIPDSDKQKGIVSMYSVHKAKGLEFPIVIIACFDNRLNTAITMPKIILDMKDETSPKLALGNDIVNSPQYGVDKDYVELLDNKVCENMEEEIRIMYVAMTRAKHMLILSCEKSYEMLEKTKKSTNYVSYAKWISEIDNGNFLKSVRYEF